VHTHAAQALGEICVIREDRAAVTEAPKRFGREEAGRRRKAKRPEPPPLVSRAERLRRIVENKETFALCNVADRLVVRALAE
jgi:hypothetical protein